jgi:hypothetical protein
MGRNWISVPLGRTRIRLGRSVSDAELFGTAEKRLPSWMKYEIRENMQKAASARGETLSKEYCNYKIDKAFALGEIDANGNPIVHGRGTNAEEVARDIITKSAEWGAGVSYEEALRTANEGIRRIDNASWTNWAIVAVLVGGFMLIFWGAWSN